MQEKAAKMIEIFGLLLRFLGLYEIILDSELNNWVIITIPGMTQKKINGYIIYMKDVLGKGSYGSVAFLISRSIAAPKTILKWNVQ